MIAAKIVNRNLLLKLALVFSVVIASVIMFSPKAKAYTVSDCGVHTGRTSSYAGAIIYLSYIDDTTGDRVYISKVGSNVDATVKITASQGQNIAHAPGGGTTDYRINSGFFGPAYAGCAYVKTIIMGYGSNGSPTSFLQVANGGNQWSLDCREDSNGQVVSFNFQVSTANPVSNSLVPVGARTGGYWSQVNTTVTNGNTRDVNLKYIQPALPISTPSKFSIRNRLGNHLKTQNEGVYTPMQNDTNQGYNNTNPDTSDVVTYNEKNLIYYKKFDQTCSNPNCTTEYNYKKYNAVSDAKANTNPFTPYVRAPKKMTINGLDWKLSGFKECTNGDTCWSSGIGSVPNLTSTYGQYTLSTDIPESTIKNEYWFYTPDMPTCSASANQTVSAGTNPVYFSFSGTNAESARVAVFNSSDLAFEIENIDIDKFGVSNYAYYNQPDGTTYIYRAYFENVDGLQSTNCSTTITKNNPVGTVDLKVNNSNGPVTIARDAALTASWSGTNLSTGTNPCTATANPTTNTWTGTKPTSGSGVALDNTTPANTPVTRVYTITCATSSGGTATDSVTVTVVPPPAVIIRANGNAGTVYVNINEPLSLTWESSNTTSCSASVPSSNPAITSWSGAKATNNSSGENHNADTAASNTITYRITCNGVTGSSPNTSASDVTVVVNALQYYPWLQTDGGDVRSVGTIVGQSLGLATNLNDNPGGRRYDSSNHASPTAEAEYVVVASGSGTNFCSFNFYNLGVQQTNVQNSCTTGGYSPASIDFGTVASSINSAWTKNGSGVSPANAKCVPHNTAIVGANINTDLSLACTDINLRFCNDGTPMGSPTCPVGSPNLAQQTTNPSPSAGGGIQKKETGNSPSNLFNLTPSGALTVNGRGTLWVRPASNVTEPSVLTITQNITYPATVNLTAPSQLPNFAIFVEGDVYISNAVTRVDATIIATGSIYTCGEGVSTTAAACSNNLVANGMWASGGTINFGRRAYNRNTPTPAEKIVLTVQSLAFPAPGLSRKDGDTSTGLEIDPNEYQPRIQ